MHPEKKYRTKILNKMVEFIHKQNDVNDIIIAGDLNSALHEDEIQTFFTRIRVTDMFSYIHDKNDVDRDPTFIQGKYYIDTVAGCEGILPYIRGCKLVNFHEIINTDHLGMIVDLDLNSYLDIKTAEFDKRENVKLDPCRKGHCKRFYEKAENLVELINLEQMMQDIEEDDAPLFPIEAIDKEFTYIFDTATRHACGKETNIIDSDMKLKLKTEQLYWKDRIRIHLNRPVDKKKMNCREK